MPKSPGGHIGTTETEHARLGHSEQFEWEFGNTSDDLQRALKEIASLRAQNIDLQIRLQQASVNEHVFSELQKAKEEAEQAKVAAEAASHAKTRFLANMSHEIRTPLGAIIGFSDLLSETISENESAQNLVTRITRNSKQLGRLIDELLDLSKIEANLLEVEKVPVDLALAIEDVFSAVVIQAKEKGILFEENRLGKIPSRVLTDPTRLRQILINLVGNAVKFTENGKVSVDWKVFETQGCLTLEVRVCDTGIGLTAEQQARIFEPFTQGDSSVTRKYGGTGLGLTLSRELARLLGGDIRLEYSVPGQGSAFVLTIALEKEDESLAKARAQTSAEKKASHPKPLLGKKILIVDDSPDNRFLVGRYLETTGALYGMACDGIEALDRVKNETFDLVLMDLQMPKLDGYQAVVQLRSQQYCGSIIALTAHALREERARCLKVGFDAYVTKPIDWGSLLEVISSLILR